jgi:hypothetical protein
MIIDAANRVKEEALTFVSRAIGHVTSFGEISDFRNIMGNIRLRRYLNPIKGLGEIRIILSFDKKLLRFEISTVGCR